MGKHVVEEDRIDLAIADCLTCLDEGSTPEVHVIAARYSVSTESLSEFLKHEYEFAVRFAEEPNETPELPGFCVLAKLGSGTFGTVWKARDEKLGRLVAIKLPHVLGGGPDQSTQFLREARNCAQLRHGNIASVIDVAQHDGTVFIISEFVDGRLLSDGISLSMSGHRQAASFCASIADALQHAHGKGVIHRDVKTSNIMLTVDSVPKLLDFGLSRSDNDIRLTADFARMGTPAYMSPELARGDSKRADHRTDIYSLGVVLFELLTGELPFRGNSEMVLYQILHDAPPRPGRLRSGIARDLETICLKCLEKQPARRYQSASELAADLKLFLEGRPIRARPVGAIERAWRWCTRNALASSLLVAVVASLLTGTIVSVRFAVRATREARTSEAVSEFMADVFRGATVMDYSNYAIGGGSIENAQLPAIELVDRGYERLQTEMRDEPEIRARLFGTLGEVYMSLGQTDRAIEAITISNQELTGLADGREQRAQLVANDHNLGSLMYLKGDWNASRRHFERAISVGESLGERYRRAVLSGRTLLAMLLSMNSDINEERAYEQMREILADCRKQDDGLNEFRSAIAAMAHICTNQGRTEEARDLMIELAALDQQHGSNDNIVALRNYSEGCNLIASGDHVNALPKLDRAVTIVTRRLGPRNIAVDSMLYDYLRCQMVVEGVDAVLSNERYETYRSVMHDRFGPRHPRFNHFLDLQGGIARRQGNHVEDVRLMHQAVENAEQNDDNVLLLKCKLARALTNARQPEKALELLVPVWQARTETPLSQYLVVRVATELARAYSARGDASHAGVVVGEAIEHLDSKSIIWLGKRSVELDRCRQALVELRMDSLSGPAWHLGYRKGRYVD